MATLDITQELQTHSGIIQLDYRLLKIFVLQDPNFIMLMSDEWVGG